MGGGGGSTFPVGGDGDGVQMLISIETHRSCDYELPIPPLDPHMNIITTFRYCSKVFFLLILYIPSTILYLQPLQAALFSLVILSLCKSLLKGNFL